MNGVMMQYFEWYLDNDGTLWNRIKEEIPKLKEMGVTAIWIPPCYKGQSSNDVGYGAYDLYDLGEFDQKGTVRTKYGTKEELLTMIRALQEHQIQVYADVVLNHKAGADEKEVFSVVKVNPDNRDEVISEPYDIEGWTKFNFPGRGDQYSEFKWYHQHFTAVDFDQRNGENGIFKIQGQAKDFSDEVMEGEKGNFDYLMHADVDFNNPDVIEEVKRWGTWFVNELGVDGLRFDALKHIDLSFINDFIDHINQTAEKDTFYVGEYWNGNFGVLDEVLVSSRDDLTLFDVPLHFNFFKASNEGAAYDMSQIFEETILKYIPTRALTFVDNHDSQLGQSLQSWVEDWFKPIAYALILLRSQGYPCVFYGDYFGCQGEHPTPSFAPILDSLLKARKEFAYGEEYLYFDHPNCVAIQRMGDAEHEGSGLLCIMSNGDAGHKDVSFGQEKQGKVFYDLTGNSQDEVTLDENGVGHFHCPSGSLSVWVMK